MDSLKSAISEQLSPIYFTIRNDISAGPWNTDQNFYGLICSPKFEGKNYQEMYKMLDDILQSMGMSGRCRFSLEPPSRWNVCSFRYCIHMLCRNSIERRGGSGDLIHKTSNCDGFSMIERLAVWNGSVYVTYVRKIAWSN
jgi:hypothetical protein